MRIEENARVEIHYDLFDEEGNLLESTAEDGPVSYVHGHDEVLPGLERALHGAAEGDELEIELAPEDAYGEYTPEGLTSIPRSELPSDLALEMDQWIVVQIEGEDQVEEDAPEDEREIEMRVVGLAPDEVVLDANHPLAGRNVTFRVKVVSVLSSAD